MSEIKKLAGQTVIYGLGTMLPRVLNYVILVPYFTKILFKDADAILEYGKVTELYAYIALLMVLLTYGMETTYFRFVSTEKDKSRVFSTIFSSICISSIVFLVVVLLFSKNIAGALKYQGEIVFIRLVTVILVVEAISAIPFAKLRIENKAKKFAILKCVHIGLNILIMLSIYNFIPKITGSNAYLNNEEGIISSKFIFWSNMLASSVILILLSSEIMDFRIKKIDIKLIKPLLIYGLPLMVSGLAGTINETLDRSIYKSIIEDEQLALTQLGIYGANYKIGALVYMFIQMYRYAVEPYFFNKAKEKDSKEQYAYLMNIFVGVVCSIGLFIVLFIDHLKGFIGVNYHEGLFIVPYIVLAYIFYGVLFNLSVWYKLSNKTYFALIIMLIGAVITVVINIVFVPDYQYGASAVAHVIAYGTMVIISYFLGKKHFEIRYNIKRIVSYLALGAVIYFGINYINVQVEFFDIVFRATILLLFVTFVIYKEGIFKIIFNERKNR